MPLTRPGTLHRRRLPRSHTRRPQMKPSLPGSLRTYAVAGVVMLLTPPPCSVAHAQASAISGWRVQHERRIASELLALVALPNVAGNDAELRKNAELLTAMFQRRGFRVEATSGAGSPVILAELNAARPRGTLTFYIHYDGQPVVAKEWTRCGPVAPCIVGPAGPVTLDSTTRLDPEWRIYGRSASDDKGPIVALLSAIEALRATSGGPAWNIRVVLDGQEEAGSANFRRFVAERGDALKGDLAITLDGPRHPSGRPTMYFGVRGGANLTVTTYAARNDLHSGNYGNWAPDPSVRLGRLLASMKEETGRVTIDGFYDSVTPLTPTELRALNAAPNVEAALAKDFGIARPERPGERLEKKLNEPTLNVLAMESGGGLSVAGRTAIPASASARIAMRLVQGIDPVKQLDLVVAHIRKQGYFVVVNREPTDEERLAHALLARVERRGGNAASRVSMEDPMAQGVIAALTKDGVPPVQLPTLGGSMPFGEFSVTLKMPTVGVSIVNHDNNQHGPDENLRLRDLWDGIEMLAAILTMPRPRVVTVP